MFAGATSRRQKDHEATIHDLHGKIGELTVEHMFYDASSGAESARATEDDWLCPRPSLSTATSANLILTSRSAVGVAVAVTLNRDGMPSVTALLAL